MQSRRLGVGMALVAVAAAVALFFVLGEEEADSPSVGSQTTTGRPSDGAGDGGAGPNKPSKPAEPEQETIVFRGGEVVGGVAELSFEKGERIRFAVSSDVADHVHLHGYDVFQDVPAGGRATFDVPASIEGVFEVELEGRVIALAEITVEP